MSRQRGQREQSDAVDSRQNALADLLSMLHALRTGAAQRRFFRLELRRSLRMHRRLALGIAVLGLAAATCMQRSCPVSQAQSLPRLVLASTAMPAGMAPARWNENADAGANTRTSNRKQGGDRRRSLFNTVAVATTLAPADFGMIRKVLIMLFGFIVLGAGAIFVLKRARTAKADPASQSSVAGMKRNGQGDSRVEDQQTLETLLFAVELGRASLDPESALGEDGSGKLQGPNGSSPAAEELKEGTVAPATRKGLEPAESPVASDAAQPFNDVPWWLAEAPARSDSSLTQSRIPKTSIAQTAQNGAQGRLLGQEEIERAPEEGRHARLPRLTELRGTLFSTGIKELGHAKQGDEHGAGRLNAETARLEALLGARERASNGTAPQTSDVEAIPAFLPAPAERDEAAERNGGPDRPAAPRQLFLPKPAKAVNGPRKVKAHQDARQPIDKVEILPSRRGQYKRKS
jgi:hypothetical protein